MKQQKVVVIYGDLFKPDITLNKVLDEGWMIVSVTAQCVATGRGAFLIVFERSKPPKTKSNSSDN